MTSWKYESLLLPESNRVGIVTCRDTPWAQLPTITADTLRHIPLLISSRTATATFDIRQWSQGSITAENLKVVGKFDLIANAAQLIRTGITSALGIDELFQLQTPDLVFIPLEPAVTVSCLAAWKKYQLLSPTCEAFLKGLKEEIHLPGKD